MVQTITPVVHGGRRSRWGASVIAHAAGAGVSSAALGAGLGAVGLILGAPWGETGLVLIASIAALYAAREAVGVAVPVPELRRQVPEWWRSEFSPTLASFLYGLGLGVGFATHLRHGTLVAVGAAALASGDPVLGAAILAPFGLARALTITAAAGSTTSERIVRASERLERWAVGAAPRIANGAALVAVTASAALMVRSGAPPGGTSGIAPLVVAAVLGWAAGAKVLRFGAWRRSLGTFGLRGVGTDIVAVAVPTSELAAVASFVVDVRLGAAVSGLLVGAFTVALLRARHISGHRLPCGCFGKTKTRDVRVLLARNGGLLGLCALVLAEPPAALRGLGAPSASEVVPAALAAIGVALIALALRHLSRTVQTGRGRQVG